MCLFVDDLNWMDFYVRYSFVHLQNAWICSYERLDGSNEQGALRKELIIAPLNEQFETATLRKSYW